ncbi:MAG: hypothetical protein IKG98_06110 [Ruminococcus sp.]|nr:hypothetical protein [Ruminococcus sp.]
MSAKAYEALSKSNELTPVSEAAQSPEQRNDDEKEQKKRIRGTLIKFGSLAVFAFIVWVFATISWFSSNSSVSGSGMGVSVEASPFELKVVGSDTGLYDNEYMDAIIDHDNHDTYSSADSTSGLAPYIKLRLTPATNNPDVAAYDIENLYTKSGTPDLKNITKHDSEDYGLNPKDFGRLQFEIIPTKPGNDITVKYQLKLSCYQIGYDNNEEFEAQFDADGSFIADNIELTKVTNADLLQLISGHIVFFYVNDQEDLVLINPLDSQGVSVTTSQAKTVTIYWAWPENLRNILGSEIDGITSSGSAQVQSLFLDHPELFLKDITSEDNTTIKDSTASALMTGSDFTRFSSKYNNADQDIGDNVKYIMLEIVTNTG